MLPSKSKAKADKKPWQTKLPKVKTLNFPLSSSKNLIDSTNPTPSVK